MSVIAALKQLQADTYLLALKTQNYHWNVRGSDFFSLHAAFETQYEELHAAVDEIAERLRALDQQAPGSFKEFLQLTTLEEGEGSQAAQIMVSTLAHDHTALAKACEKHLEIAEKANDQVTMDFFIERAAYHQKTAWLLKSYAG